MALTMPEEVIIQIPEFRSRYESIVGPLAHTDWSEFLYEAALCDILAGKLVIIRKKRGCLPVAESR